MNDDTTETTESTAEKTPIEIAIDDARSKFPKRRLYAANSAAGILIFGDPPLTQYQHYESLLYSDEPAIKASAARELMLSCAVVPDRKGVEALIRNGYPGLSRDTEVLRACAFASGMTKEAEAKK